ncbi:hypothetical protein GCM10010080_02390 [Thermomonas carbonis]|nr:hypothetical protein GCM10010080_02390 [Thermomonas carbonis]
MHAFDQQDIALYLCLSGKGYARRGNERCGDDSEDAAAEAVHGDAPGCRVGTTDSMPES